MLMRYGQAAMLAATMILAMSGARAEDPPAKGTCGACCKNKDCCKSEECHSIGSTCANCYNDKKCCKDGTCCKSAECCKTKECCKGSCGADCGCCCSTKGKQAKKASVIGPIIVVMPVPMAAPAMPVHFGCPACSGMTMACPMLPPPTLTPPMMPPHAIAMPVPPPPGYAPCPYGGGYGSPVCAPMPCPAAAAPQADTGIDPCLAILGLMSDLCSSHLQPPSLPAMCMLGLGVVEDLCSLMSNHGATMEAGTYLQHPPQYIPPSPPYPLARELARPEEACPAAMLPPPTPCEGPYSCPVSPTPPMVTCSAASPVAAVTKVRIVAKPDSDQLEMSVGDDACMSCKKMVVKVGDNALTLSRIDDQVRVRAVELRAKANCVRTDRKDHLILEGDVELHYSKDGQCAKVMADRVELNLATGSVTIKTAVLERIGVNFP